MMDYLKFYPEYDSVYGPYLRKDNRNFVILRNSVTKRQTTRMVAKIVLELKLNRLLRDDETVDHINGMTYDDSPDNLRILSRAENARIAAIGNSNMLGYKQTEEQKRSGEKNGQARMTNDQVYTARCDFAYNGVSVKTLERRYGLTNRAIRNMLDGISYASADGPTRK